MSHTELLLVLVHRCQRRRQRCEYESGDFHATLIDHFGQISQVARRSVHQGDIGLQADALHADGVVHVLGVVDDELAWNNMNELAVGRQRYRGGRVDDPFDVGFADFLVRAPHGDDAAAGLHCDVHAGNPHPRAPDRNPRHCGSCQECGPHIGYRFLDINNLTAV